MSDNKQNTKKTAGQGGQVDVIVIPMCHYCYETNKMRKNGIKYGNIGNTKYQIWACDNCHSTNYQEIDFYTNKPV